jgi:hypothetical protein
MTACHDPLLHAFVAMRAAEAAEQREAALAVCGIALRMGAAAPETRDVLDALGLSGGAA